MSTTTSGQIGSVEKMVLALETPPWDSAYRAVIGYGVMPVYLRLPGESGASWKLFVFFLAVLVALRIVPAMMRRVLPFSREVKSVWADRRALAKRYDSYQWRKLFGLGLGWLLYLLVSGKAQGAPLFLSVASVIAGAFGLTFWLRASRVLATQQAAAAAS